MTAGAPGSPERRAGARERRLAQTEGPAWSLPVLEPAAGRRAAPASSGQARGRGPEVRRDRPGMHVFCNLLVGHIAHQRCSYTIILETFTKFICFPYLALHKFHLFKSEVFCFNQGKLSLNENGLVDRAVSANCELGKTCKSSYLCPYL